MSMKTYHGSCFCGRATFEADIDFELTPTGRCNCRSCRKRRWWTAQIPPEQFRLKSGEDRCLKIKTNGGAVLRLCPDCGVLVFGRTEKQEWNDGPRIGVNVATLDDLDPGTLLAAPAVYYDGLHDNWWSAPDEVRHL